MEDTTRSLIISERDGQVIGVLETVTTKVVMTRGMYYLISLASFLRSQHQLGKAISADWL